MRTKSVKTLDQIAEEFFNYIIVNVSRLEDKHIVLPKTLISEMTADMASRLSDMSTEYAQEILDSQEVA